MKLRNIGSAHRKLARWQSVAINLYSATLHGKCECVVCAAARKSYIDAVTNVKRDWRGY